MKGTPGCTYCDTTQPLVHDAETTCENCRRYMKDGILVIAAHGDGTRAGGFIVVKEQTMLEAIIDPNLRKHVKEERAFIMSPECWEDLGLPKLRPA